MSEYILLIIFIILHAAGVRPTDDDTDFYMAGGEIAKDGQFPYQVSMETYTGEHFCGGSILDKRWILTAAHCITGFILGNIRIITGINRLSEAEMDMGYEIEKYYIQKVARRQEQDVALIRVTRDIEFGPKVQPVKLSRDLVKGDEDLTVSGWGRLSFNGNLSDELRYLTYKSISLDECKQIYPVIFTKNDDLICTLKGLGTAICMGDSGGPLVRANTYEQVGIAIATTSNCTGKNADLFARISLYYDWIISITTGRTSVNNVTKNYTRTRGSINFYNTYFINTNISL